MGLANAGKAQAGPEIRKQAAARLKRDVGGVQPWFPGWESGDLRIALTTASAA